MVLRLEAGCGWIGRRLLIALLFEKSVHKIIKKETEVGSAKKVNVINAFEM